MTMRHTSMGTASALGSGRPSSLRNHGNVASVMPGWQQEPVQAEHWRRSCLLSCDKPAVPV
eukprot:34845-Eustigmatos_ZCMA.PRE.1